MYRTNAKLCANVVQVKCGGSSRDTENAPNFSSRFPPRKAPDRGGKVSRRHLGETSFAEGLTLEKTIRRGNFERPCGRNPGHWPLEWRERVKPRRRCSKGRSQHDTI